jgi:hypothetical protein
MGIGRPKGYPKTGGRKPGTPNKRTAERKAAVEAAAERVNELLPNAFQGDAHAFLITVYKDPSVDMHTRIDAARAAIGYEKPRQSSVEMTRSPGAIDFESMRSDEIEATLTKILIEHGVKIAASSASDVDDEALMKVGVLAASASDADDSKPQ